MTEFNNRIDAQREILNIVNSYEWQEQLFGLAGKTINRWVLANRIDPSSKLATLIREAGAKLFFLANKSQEQITSDYEILSNEVKNISQQILLEIQLKTTQHK